MLAYCNNQPVLRNDSSGNFPVWIIPVIVVPLILSGCNKNTEEEYLEKRRKLRSSMSLEELEASSINNKDQLYNCYGFAIGKAYGDNPTGYVRGENVKEVFSHVVDDLGEENVKRLYGGMDSPIDDGWYRVALRCSKDDYHFIRQIGDKWYSKSSTLPVFEIYPNEIQSEHWYTIISDSSIPNNRYEMYNDYTGTIIYFAVREGWAG